MCSSSPCGGMNQSDWGGDDWIVDYSGVTASNYFIAPLNLLNFRMLGLVGGYEFIGHSNFSDQPYSDGFLFDRKNEVIEVGPDLAQADKGPLLIAYFSLKLLTLLNLPLWILLAVGFIKFRERFQSQTNNTLRIASKFISTLVALAIILGLGFIKFFLSIMYGNDYSLNVIDLILS